MNDFFRGMGVDNLVGDHDVSEFVLTIEPSPMALVVDVEKVGSEPTPERIGWISVPIALPKYHLVHVSLSLYGIYRVRP
jgi:hypothetical protein